MREKVATSAGRKLRPCMRCTPGGDLYGSIYRPTNTVSENLTKTKNKNKNMRLTFWRN